MAIRMGCSSRFSEFVDLLASGFMENLKLLGLAVDGFRKGTGRQLIDCRIHVVDEMNILEG